ncbi:hypothetical protein CCM_03811 [Cordyceps militaris CM01]|uniref:Uncharacterized protein n=1 Tax=Cordyceps militaris (strain CM01) TaxID=983644 RepID=G3JGS4_CORMM|nr:uncharacterized protein CCM_03811 [Cordyceps militaris CM01]EGX92438.1 hypothetical protein CCM_03811 [Cordyceps militaris CM01]
MNFKFIASRFAIVTCEACRSPTRRHMCPVDQALEQDAYSSAQRWNPGATV